MLLINFFGYSQFSNKEQREIVEIKNIFKDFSTNKLVLPIYLERDGSIILPNYFTSYNKYYNDLNISGLWNNFIPNKYLQLTKIDCFQINKILYKDTIRTRIQDNWLFGDKIKIISDSVGNNNEYTTSNFIKPIFFRNFKRCFMAYYSSNVTQSFFLIKKGSHWKFDKYFLKAESD